MRRLSLIEIHPGNNLISEGYSFSTELENRKKCATEFQIDISINIAERLKEFQEVREQGYIEDLKSLLECIKQQKELLLTLEQKINESNTKTNQHLATVKSFQDEKNL